MCYIYIAVCYRNVCTNLDYFLLTHFIRFTKYFFIILEAERYVTTARVHKSVNNSISNIGNRNQQLSIYACRKTLVF